MARTYAICSNSRVVLAVLGILFLGSLIPDIVCDYTISVYCEVLTFHSWEHSLIAACSPLHMSKWSFCVHVRYDHKVHTLTCRLQGCELFSIYVVLTIDFSSRGHNWIWWNVLACEENQGDDNVREPHNELMIKVGETQECLDCLEVSWGRPDTDHVSLGHVHGDASGGDHKA